MIDKEKYKNCPGYPERQWYTDRGQADRIRQKGERIYYTPGCGYYIVKTEGHLKQR